MSNDPSANNPRMFALEPATDYGFSASRAPFLQQQVCVPNLSHLVGLNFRITGGWVSASIRILRCQRQYTFVQAGPPRVPWLRSPVSGMYIPPFITSKIETYILGEQPTVNRLERQWWSGGQ